MTHLTRYSFGMTSAIVTSLAIIVGLSGTAEPRMAILASLLVIAIADNISDSLGIHIFQESDLKGPKVVTVSTFSNFFTRAAIVTVFIALVAFLPISNAIVASVVLGLSLLAYLSYEIAKEQKTKWYWSILTHESIAILVIVASLILRIWILGFFS